MDPYVALISAVAGLVAIIGGIGALARWLRPKAARWGTPRRARKNTGITSAPPNESKANAHRARMKKGLGKLRRRTGEFHEARRLFTEAYDEFVGLDNLRGQANALMNRGILFRMMNEWADSKQDHTDADRLLHQANDPPGQADNLKNYGAMYRDMGDQRRAIEVLLQSLEIYESLGSSMKVAELKQRIGTNFAELGETDSARSYLDSALLDSADEDFASGTQG